MSEPRIALIIGAKFPTTRAYGVTFRETTRNLVRQSVPVRVFCRGSDYSDADYTEFLSYIHAYNLSILSRIAIRIGETNLGKFSQSFWALSLVLDLISNSKHIKNFQPNIVWTRDPIIALFCVRKFSNLKIILEIHSKSNRTIFSFLSKYNSRIHFFPINTQNDLFIKKCIPNSIRSLAPMGVRGDYLASNEEIEDFTKLLANKKGSKIEIGYVGKYNPQGYSKGLEDLFLLAKLYQDRAISNKVTISGIPIGQIPKLELIRSHLNIDPNFLSFEQHLSHTKALERMRDFDVLVLTLPESQVYNGMPLKLLEYLATGRIVIVAKSDLIKDFFINEFTPLYYEKGNIEDLFIKILESQNCKKMSLQILNGVRFASKFTWELRTKKILSIVMN